MDPFKIPIRNLYYLLCYSWDCLEQGSIVDVSRCPSTQLIDLYALVLCTGLRHLARRGLEQGYETQVDEVSSPRGRIDALTSARRFLTRHGRASCQFDELTISTHQNQIVKAALELLSRSPELHPALRGEVGRALRLLSAVDSLRLTSHAFRQVQLHSNTRFYRFLVSVCELVYQSALVEEHDGTVRFRDFIRDERAMSRVFEQFLFSFIRRHVPNTQAKRERIGWHAQSETDPSLSMLPAMNTDISVHAPGVHLIIDAKYYSRAVSAFRGTPKYHSGNLYQLMSYLNNAPNVSGIQRRGMLVYPRVDRHLRDRYVIQGHPVTIATVDLAQDWCVIHEEIVGLLQADLLASPVSLATTTTPQIVATVG